MSETAASNPDAPVEAGRRPFIVAGAVVLLLGVGALSIGVASSLPAHRSGRSGTVLAGANVNGLPPVPGPPLPTGLATTATGATSPAATVPAHSTAPRVTPSADLRPTATASSGSLSAASKPTPEPAKKPTRKAKPAVPVAAAGVNLALHRTVTESSHTQTYAAANVTDGDSSTYWEGQSGFPQTLTVDLGSVTTVGRMRLALPPVSDWNSRTQTIAVYASKNGSAFTVVRGAAGYAFDANSAGRNSVTVSLPRTAARFIQLRFSANSGWPAAQLSELQIHSS